MHLGSRMRSKERQENDKRDDALGSDVVHELVVDEGTARKEEARPRAQLVEEEELLLTTDLAVVPLSRLG
jgi:ribosome assembly protein YihI (activator of Der GTPase)